MESLGDGFKIGDRVVLTEAGLAELGEGPRNPRGVSGSVVRAPQRMSAWVWILWDNGNETPYHRAEQLQPAVLPAR
jgi:hypothetical protein